MTKQGYRLITRNGKTIYEHRAIVEDMLGRPLAPDEQVHHRNGDKLDNRSQNLELWVSSHPSGQRVADLIIFAEEILTRYESEANNPALQQTNVEEGRRGKPRRPSGRDLG